MIGRVFAGRFVHERVSETIKSRSRAGETVESLVRDYELPREVVEAILGRATPRGFPVQARTDNRKPGQIAESVHLRAYEVYAHVYGEQDALLDLERGCRGGFGTGELVALLYARAFPREEWRARVNEAFEGMNL